MSNTTHNTDAARDAGQDIRQRMLDDGYEYNGITWLSPYCGELLSFEYAREEYEDRHDDRDRGEWEAGQIYGDAQ